MSYMTTVLYYVTSHGYGHAVRSAQVMAALLRKPGIDIVVRTAAPRWFFPSDADHNVAVEPADVDPGPVQLDSITTDISATYDRFSDQHRNFDIIVKNELEVIDRIKPSVIVADIAPVGVEAASRARIPVVVVANFVWDWILGDYARSRPDFIDLARFFHAIYAKADKILRTPLSGGFDEYGNIVNIPLIAKTSAKTRRQARRDLGLPDNPVALVSFGGVGMDRFFRDVERRVTLFDIIMPGNDMKHNGRVRCFGGDMARHEDLVAACDVVIGKMGYGLCSELICAGRHLLYTARSGFIEFDTLSEQTKKYISALELTEKEFFDGRLDSHIIQLLQTPHPEESPPLGGAQVAADIIHGLT